ncbi:MAG: TetR family transcriptional regulator [Nocardioides sp.]|uniref:TetR/AcrR family transcriptional regulator n=1 Tax=Nocardioides sp. TaxID=35761 RepID=UPI0039E4F684
MNKRRRGRPSGPTTARADILDAARRGFLEHGYAGTTLRAVAAEAGVDAALISYHFGSKSGLFGASMGLTANPPQVLAAVLEGPAATLPERLVRAVLGAWDDPERGLALRRLAEGAIRDPEVARLFREMAEKEMVGRIADHLGGRQARARAAAAAAQLAGLIFLRYLLRVEPFASASADELARQLTPALRMVLLAR